MTEVGVRELRDGLSRYLESVQSGEEIVVTDRGTAIARIVPLNRERTLDRLIREGLVTPARSRTRRRPKPIVAKGAVSDLIADQRR
jgi:prevent-host-death family protein